MEKLNLNINTPRTFLITKVLPRMRTTVTQVYLNGK